MYCKKHGWRARSRSSILRTGLIGGAAASLASTVALALLGRRETGSYSAATNSTSHWLWDRSAFVVYTPTLRHTGVGYTIHHATATFWAVLYAWVRGDRCGAASVPAELTAAGVAAATACMVDYTLTPERLTPGFEHHLSTRAMTIVYAAFGVGLAFGCVAAGRRQR